jgi:hypothetical protein
LVPAHHEVNHSTKVLEESGGTVPQTLNLKSFLNGQLSEKKTGGEKVGFYMGNK